MLIPTRIEIIETHKDAEQPYHLIKVIFETVKIVKGKEVIMETSNLAIKNIRPKGHVLGAQLSAAQLEAKRKKEIEQEAAGAAELLRKAESSETGKSDESIPETADQKKGRLEAEAKTKAKLAAEAKALEAKGPAKAASSPDDAAKEAEAKAKLAAEMSKPPEDPKKAGAKK